LEKKRKIPPERPTLQDPYGHNKGEGVKRIKKGGAGVPY